MTVTKKLQVSKVDEEMKEQSSQSLPLYANEMDVESPEEKARNKIEGNPYSTYHLEERKQDQVEEDQEMEVDDQQEVDFDIEAFNSRLFATSDYPLFAFGNTDDNKILVDAYGVHNPMENQDLYLNNISNNLAGAEEYIGDGADDMDAGIGKPSLNNSVTYDYIKEYYKNHQFLYNCVDENVVIECQTAYIPFEGRIDKKSFQIMLSETRPKNLIIVNASEKKVDRIKHFVNENLLNIKVSYVKDGVLSFKIARESPMVLIEPNLVNFTSRAFPGTVVFPSSDRYSVNRIYGLLKHKEEKDIDESQQTQGNIFNKITSPTSIKQFINPVIDSGKAYMLQDLSDDQEGLLKKEHYLFESKSLFFKDV